MTKRKMHAMTVFGAPAICGRRHAIRGAFLGSTHARKTYAITCNRCRKALEMILKFEGKHK